MAIVNYVRESKAFIAFASDNKVSANEFVLWHALFNLFNLQATSNVWPDGFIPVSNSRLLSYTTFGAGKTGEETLRKTRDKLIQRGLIAYKAGERNKRNPTYRMIYFYPSPEADVTQEILGNPQGNMTGNMQGNMRGNTTGNMGDIVDKQIRYGNGNRIPRDENDDSATRAYGRARREAENGFEPLFGRKATAAELDHIAHVAVSCGTSAILGEAMERAAIYGAKNPAAYVATVCGAWCDEGITTGRELARYDLLRDAIDGKLATGLSPEEAADELRSLRHRLQSKKDGEPCAKEAL